MDNSCKLNQHFKKALKHEKIEIAWGEVFYDSGDGDDDRFMNLSHGLMCCGVTELNLTDFFRFWIDHRRDNNLLESALASLIKGAAGDKRILIVGLPTRVSENSEYDIKYYRWLRKTFLSFGFRSLCKPYRNENSGNNIVVLAGQLP